MQYPYSSMCIDFRDILKTHFNLVMGSQRWKDYLTDERLRRTLRNFYDDNENLPAPEKKRLSCSPKQLKYLRRSQPPGKKKKKKKKRQNQNMEFGYDDMYQQDQSRSPDPNRPPPKPLSLRLRNI